MNSFSALGGRDLNKNFPKIQMHRGLPGRGMLKLRFDWYINCRLQLAGLGKKREETVKPTFGATDTTDKSFTVFFAR